jgi:protocatechuate 3,4-dioxygenase beta subunit
MTSILITLMALLFQSLVSSLEGRVVKSGTNEPVGHAGILLTRNGGRLSDSLTAITDEQGRFYFAGVPAGDYRLFGEHEDYVKTEFGQRNPGRQGSAITLAQGEKIENITLELIATGLITGRVVDQDGEPVRARIQALKRSYANGQSQWTLASEVPTNDLGQYRMFDLPPGSYVLSATPYGYQYILSGQYFGLDPPRLDALVSLADSPYDISVITQEGGFLDPAAIRGERRLTQYFPRVSDINAARPIDVKPATVIDDANFQLVPLPGTRRNGVTVRGRVIDGTTGQPMAEGFVQLGTPEHQFAMDSLNRSIHIMPAAKGSFQMNDVSPGRYVMLASSDTGMSEKITVDVADSGNDGVLLVLSPRGILNGRIIVDEQGAAPDFTKMTVLIDAPFSGRETTPRADGTFSFQNTMNGEYRLVLGGTVANFYLKAAHFGSEDVLSAGLLLKAPVQEQLELVISPKTATIDGVVTEKEGHPAPGVRVVLVPDATHRMQFEMFRAVSSDATGRFHIEGVPPCEYQVFAWEDIEENAWQIPELLRPYERLGKELFLNEGARENLNLQMIPR